MEKTDGHLIIHPADPFLPEQLHGRRIGRCDGK